VGQSTLEKTYFFLNPTRFEHVMSRIIS